MYKTPNLYFERKLWKRGYINVGGVDEVGRGCFAGPVVAACVVLTPNLYVQGVSVDSVKIDDSKKLTKLQRERASEWIKKNALTWGIGEASASLINRIGLTKATEVSFRKAILVANERLGGNVDFLLIDAFYIPYVRGLRRKNQIAIVNGDEISLSIAAASIIAKVYRDTLMEKIGSRRRYKKYGWGNSKGDGTKVHREAIIEYGITGYHRKKFVETFIGRSKEN